MRIVNKIFAFALMLAVTAQQFSLAALACGPSFVEPVFALESSPDVPLENFIRGRIGIVKPTWGRKSLFIAFRLMNGAAFSFDEERALLEALSGAAPEEDKNDEAVKNWIAARKQIAAEEKTSPIYRERNYAGYNFFPNCTRNAFEVATETLKNRVASYGADNKDVREWLVGQDAVFEICSSGSDLPRELGAESAGWLRKDREYQIAAAKFYALNFDQARADFEKIAADAESDWRETADYLIARTLVRQASLTKDDARSREIYLQAEWHLSHLLGKGGKFYSASKRLLGLVKYRTQPEERLQELANQLAYQNGNDNLRQDLIDYEWLIADFEAEILKIEEQRKETLRRTEKIKKGETVPEPTSERVFEWQAKQREIETGEKISIGISYQKPDAEYPGYAGIDFKFDAADAEILKAFEEKIGRKLTAEELEKLKEAKERALEQRKIYLGANFRFARDFAGSDRRDYWGDDELNYDLMPAFLRSTELTDWLLTFEIASPDSYAHAVKKWRETDSPAWFAAAIVKAETTSPDLNKILSTAENFDRNSPAFPTVAFHLVRLKIAIGKKEEARKLLDEILSTKFAGSELLSVSSRNQFSAQRMSLAKDLSEFLKFARRQPFAFSRDGFFGTIDELIEEEKGYFDPEYYKESKEEWNAQVEAKYREMKNWESSFTFDDETIEIINERFSLETICETAQNRELPDYLRRRLMLAAFTRSILLKRADFVAKTAPQTVRLEPRLNEFFEIYLQAKSPQEIQIAETWLFLKNPYLTPFLTDGTMEVKEIDSYSDGWWIVPEATIYDYKSGEEKPKSVPTPDFLTKDQIVAAQKEKAAIKALGDAEAFISARVLEWAQKFAPRDARVPEALYLVAEMNLPTKYAGGDVETREKAIKILKTRYRRSKWAAKISEEK